MKTWMVWKQGQEKKITIREARRRKTQFLNCSARVPAGSSPPCCRSVGTQEARRCPEAYRRWHWGTGHSFLGKMPEAWLWPGFSRDQSPRQLGRWFDGLMASCGAVQLKVIFLSLPSASASLWLSCSPGKRGHGAPNMELLGVGTPVLARPVALLLNQVAAPQTETCFLYSRVTKGKGPRPMHAPISGLFYS